MLMEDRDRAQESKVLLRRLMHADKTSFARWFRDPEVTKTLAGRTAPVQLLRKEEMALGTTSEKHQLVRGIVERRTENLIGATGLYQINRRHKTAYLFVIVGDKTAWAKGYGGAAAGLMLEYTFLEIGLNRVMLHVYEYNIRGVRAYERVGFKREGKLVADQYYDGRFWDTIVMGMTRADWTRE